MFMKIRINNREQELSDQASLIEVVRLVRSTTADDPMLKAIRERAGDDHISYLVNGKVVTPQEYETTPMKEGDEVRWIHPAFGG